MDSDVKSLRHSTATLAKDNDNLSELTTELRLALGASYDKSKAKRAFWEKCLAIDETNILLHDMIEHVEKLEEHLVAIGVKLLNNDGKYEFPEEESDVPEGAVDVATREDAGASTEFSLTEHPELDRETQQKVLEDDCDDVVKVEFRPPPLVVQALAEKPRKAPPYAKVFIKTFPLLYCPAVASKLHPKKPH
ncbi:unnamed protein product [Heligmosomoides polygyrus]|uniref:DUF4485 domain-containing protein n=1 Tax=Heligmosomoides polygyrus TaxID=6339 RepID=A0A3P7YZR3_HELPZ|nr:unnamed protein product [Heligmosomoides polygyrus]